MWSHTLLCCCCLCTSRLADPEFVWDTTCFTDADDLNVDRHPVIDYQPETTPGGVAVVTDEEPPLLPGEDGSVCVAHNGARKPFTTYPLCWDFNSTVDATKNCTGIGGTAPNCLTVGYAQTAFIAECRAQYRLSGKCGTFLEIHVAGKIALWCAAVCMCILGCTHSGVSCIPLFR